MSSLCQTRVLELSESDATVTCARYAQHGVKMLSARRQAWQVADPRERTEAAHWATGRPCVTHILLIFTDDLALVKDVFVSKGGIAHPHLLASQHCGRHPGPGTAKAFRPKRQTYPARGQKLVAVLDIADLLNVEISHRLWRFAHGHHGPDEQPLSVGPARPHEPRPTSDEDAEGRTSVRVSR